MLGRTALAAISPAAAVGRAAALLRQVRAVFAVGNGRSGFVVRVAAMRLMHVGLGAHVVAETTTAAITVDDAL
jgi:6-phospho-3-hexuloisomerase